MPCFSEMLCAQRRLYNDHGYHLQPEVRGITGKRSESESELAYVLENCRHLRADKTLAFFLFGRVKACKCKRRHSSGANEEFEKEVFFYIDCKVCELYV